MIKKIEIEIKSSLKHVTLSFTITYFLFFFLFCLGPGGEGLQVVGVKWSGRNGDLTMNSVIQ